MSTEAEIRQFAEGIAESDRKAFKLAAEQEPSSEGRESWEDLSDAVWQGEHTTALRGYLGRQPTQDEVELAARVYAADMRRQEMAS